MSSSGEGNRQGKRVAVLVLMLIVVAWTFSMPVASAVSSTGTSTPIKHVVVITMENHSFDNLFGVYPYDSSPSNTTLLASVTKPLNILSGGVKEVLSAVPNGSFSTGNPEEGYSAYHLDWNNGLMNGFLNGSGKNSLNYFTASQMAVEWILAQQYALGDMYFSSILSETVPNRLYALAGFSPVMNDYGPPPYIPLNQTIFYQLTNNGVSWGYYLNSTSRIYSPLSIIQGMGQYSSDIQQWGDFYSQLSNGSLPAVSWLMPIHGGGEVYSQHPSYNVLAGELWLLYTVNRIMHSPEWNSTAIFINYDEGGGYYDQVAPPVISGHQLGFRVPFIVISPYAKENYISSTVLSHTSILAFIEYNWHLDALNSLVQNSNIPLDMFNFNATYQNGQIIRPPLSFTPGVSELIPQTYDFGPGAYGDISNLASLFPMDFQMPVSSLPYNQSGSSNVTLGSLGYGVAVQSNFLYIPLYQDHALIAAVLVSGTAALYFYSRRLVRRKRS